MLGYPSAGPVAEAVAYLPRLTNAPRDEFFWMCQIDKASIISNHEEHLISDQQAARFAQGLQKTIEQGSLAGSARPKMYIRFEPLVIKHAGIESTLIHAGRSSQDIHSTFHRTVLREQLLRFMQLALAARQSLLTKIRENFEVIVPNYTNGVAAQPNALAHQWLGHVQSFERDFRALAFAWQELNFSPMGSCVLNGTGWPLNRKRMAQLLGFDGVLLNAYDAGQIATEDAFLSVSQVLVAPMLHLGHFLQDIMTQYAQSRPWILVSSTYASSAMPQKRNPGSLIDIRRDASQVLSATQSEVWRLHNLMPGMYDGKDLAITGELFEDACQVMDAFGKVLALLKIDASRALEELNSDWTASQELADILMRRFAIPFRIGHRFASSLVSFARTNQFTPKNIRYEDVCTLWYELAAKEQAEEPGLAAAFPLSKDAFFAALDPLHIVSERQTEGGPQLTERQRLLDQATTQYEADCEWVKTTQDKLQQRENDLEQIFCSLILSAS